jgi:hypothetical protein
MIVGGGNSSTSRPAVAFLYIIFFITNHQTGNLAEWSKALESGSSLRAWVQIPQLS